MNLIIDAGNTYVKLAVFQGETIVFDVSVEKAKVEKQLLSIFKVYPKIDGAIVSSVGNLTKNDLDVIPKNVFLHELTPSSKVPFINKYGTPKSLGVDRIALVTAAYHLFQNSNVLVIDAGTCVTYDIITNMGEYLGGAIAPGINMRYNALHNQTSKLPLLEKDIIVDFIGNSTATSIHSGVVNGLCTELEGVINQYNSRFKDLTVILTGGDTHFLSKTLKNTIFADSKFLLKGLNYLLAYNR